MGINFLSYLIKVLCLCISEEDNRLQILHSLISFFLQDSAQDSIIADYTVEINNNVYVKV